MKQRCVCCVHGSFKRSVRRDVNPMTSWGLPVRRGREEVRRRDDNTLKGARDDSALKGARDDNALKGAPDDNALKGSRDDNTLKGARDDNALKGARDDNALKGAPDEEGVMLRDFSNNRTPLNVRDLGQFAPRSLTLYGSADDAGRNNDVAFSDVRKESVFNALQNRMMTSRYRAERRRAKNVTDTAKGNKGDVSTPRSVVEHRANLRNDVDHRSADGNTREPKPHRRRHKRKDAAVSNSSKGFEKEQSVKHGRTSVPKRTTVTNLSLDKDSANDPGPKRPRVEFFPPPTHRNVLVKGLLYIHKPWRSDDSRTENDSAEETRTDSDEGFITEPRTLIPEITRKLKKWHLGSHGSGSRLNGISPHKDSVLLQRLLNLGDQRTNM